MKPNEPVDKLQNEAVLRQRNVVYPDTVRNEAAGYCHLLSARRLSRVKRIGGAFIGLLFTVLGGGVAFSSVLAPRMFANSSSSRMFGIATIPLALMMLGVGVVFAVLGIRLLRRVVRSSNL